LSRARFGALDTHCIGVICAPSGLDVLPTVNVNTLFALIHLGGLAAARRVVAARAVVVALHRDERSERELVLGRCGPVIGDVKRTPLPSEPPSMIWKAS
jgi:hypothetical protein